MTVARRTVLMGGGTLALVAGIAGRAASPPAFDIAAIEHDRLLRLGARYLDVAPRTITAIPAARSPAGPHDYYSEADYWWPDPANPGGPYVRRDGYSNPAKFVGHRDALIAVSVTAPALVAAWKVSRDTRFARQAERHLDAWFADPVTRMNPNLDHAQAIIGVNTGRGIGVIDTLHLVEVARAIQVLEAGDYRLAHRDAIRGWFRAYLTWLTSSKNGTDEREEKNNHGTCWALQAAAFAALLGDRAVREQVRVRFRERLVPGQIAPDGRQPLELARTKPYSYALFNLDVLATIAQLVSDGGDLWRFATPDGRSLPAALAYMAPFIADKRGWPYPPDVEHFADLPVRQPSLLFGGLALGREDYLVLWRRLDPDPGVGEIIRNYPIRQPVLWL